MRNPTWWMMTHKIRTLAQLEALYGTPSEASLRKVSDRLTPAYQEMIEAAPFFALATIGEDGLDCTPRGDQAQAVTILDPQTIAIPDRRGNNRLDTLRNLIEDPRCALLFLIPGVNECIRINGTAEITTDPELTAKLAHKGKEPVTVIKVTIGELYFQCARAIIRSGIWDKDAQRDRKSLPSAGEMAKSAFQEFDAISYDQDLPERQAKTLY